MNQRWEIWVGLLGTCMLIWSHYTGLFVAPPEAMMGDVGRILYAHVPTAWVGLLTYLVAFIAAIGALATGKVAWDAMVEATVEVGLLLNVLLLIQGSLWAKPTWGVYWTWDPRLTTCAIMVVAFGVVLALRRQIDAPMRRLTECFSMYSDMSIRTIALSSSKRKSASVRASSVFPTPVGPRNKKDPIGRLGS